MGTAGMHHSPWHLDCLKVFATPTVFFSSSPQSFIWFLVLLSHWLVITIAYRQFSILVALVLPTGRLLFCYLIRPSPSVSQYLQHSSWLSYWGIPKTEPLFKPTPILYTVFSISVNKPIPLVFKDLDYPGLLSSSPSHKLLLGYILIVTSKIQLIWGRGLINWELRSNIYTQCVFANLLHLCPTLVTMDL